MDIITEQKILRIKQDWGYSGKPKQWQMGFDAILREIFLFSKIKFPPELFEQELKEIAKIHKLRTGWVNTLGSVQRTLKELMPDILSFMSKRTVDEDKIRKEWNRVWDKHMFGSKMCEEWIELIKNNAI